jgi:hypothetical protein
LAIIWAAGSIPLRGIIDMIVYETVEKTDSWRKILIINLRKLI